MSALTSTLRDDYVAALLAGDGTRARHLIDVAVADGLGPAEVYLEVLQEALYTIGELWERGRIGVAYEHFATTVTQGVIGALGPRMRIAPNGGRLAVLTCTPGEQHALGVQVLGDFLEGAGWEVLQLGAGLPVDELSRLVADEQPDIVGLSTATAGMLPGAFEVLARLHELHPRPYLVVGGLAWADAAPTRIKEVGADVLVPGPLELVTLIKRRFPPLPEDD